MARRHFAAEEADAAAADDRKPDAFGAAFHAMSIWSKQPHSPFIPAQAGIQGRHTLIFD